MGMGISDGANQVATLGEKTLHYFDGAVWKTIDRESEDLKWVIPGLRYT